jgi:putative DNA primase/helicase
VGEVEEGRMTSFVDFCRIHGVEIDRLPDVGVWRRFRTTDKPAHRNGAVKYMGDHGFCQNHATMVEVAVWRSEGESREAAQRVQAVANHAAQETVRAQRRAADKAGQMLSECELKAHPYLSAKGFPDERVNVNGEHMLIPMRVGRDVVGVQTINADGEKKFLFGQRCSLAQFIFASAVPGTHIVCEGYATALSIRQAMAAIKRPYTLHVCFSAGNMKKVAQSLQSGFVVADNDASGTGERIAKEIGWPYWMSDTVGEDANDYHQRKGLFPLSQGMQRLFMNARRQ